MRGCVYISSPLDAVERNIASHTVHLTLHQCTKYHYSAPPFDTGQIRMKRPSIAAVYYTGSGRGRKIKGALVYRPNFGCA